MKRVERRISDRRVLKLLKAWLTAGVMEDGLEETTLSGTPQGGVISPLLSNIYLSYLDEVWEQRCSHLGTLVRYADDFVVMCRTRSDVEEAERRVGLILARLKLQLHPEKTRKVNLSWGQEGFDFLGCHFHKRLSGPIWERERKRVYFLQRWPSTRSMKRLREKVKGLTDRRWNGVKDVRVLMERLNPIPRFGALSSSRDRTLSGDRVMSPFERIPVSRVRENRTHGLKGFLPQTCRSL